MDDKFETLGQIIDALDSLTYSTKLPMPAEFHLEQLNKLLPEKVAELKAVFIEITGENPWE